MLTGRSDHTPICSKTQTLSGELWQAIEFQQMKSELSFRDLGLNNSFIFQGCFVFVLGFLVSYLLALSQYLGLKDG